MPCFGHLQESQTAARALHNIQVDPDNPMNVHAVIMQETGDSLADASLLKRRILYTFSSDGGKDWTTPDTLGNTREGFVCMILYKLHGKYVPIIAGHRYTSNNIKGEIESAIWVEQGNPGDNNFAMTECGDAGVNGTAYLLYPYIGISPDYKTIYIVGTYSAVNGSSTIGYFQFGTFSLDTNGNAVFNNWTQELGDNNSNDGAAGFVDGGDYVLRVSPSGKIGILWREADWADPNSNLYFIESTDGGHTWPQTFPALEGLGSIDWISNALLGPFTGLDFFYAGENAKIVWTNEPQQFPGDTTNEWYPSTCAFHLYDYASGNDYAFVSTIAYDTSRQGGDTGLDYDTAQYTLYDSLVFWDTTDRENDLMMDYPTIAQSPDTNVFSVYYQVFRSADTVQINKDTVNLYGSIYYQTTTDGGATWTAPTQYHVNTGPGNTYGKIDYRWPQVSDWNPLANGAPNTTVMFAADTAAGTNDALSILTPNTVYFYHQQAALSGVTPTTASITATAVSYPDPFTSSTTINFTLPIESSVLLTVTDVLGRPVATLVNGRLGAGTHSAVFNAANLADGVYRYTLETNGASTTGSMSLVR